jgi:hypothetical protein
MDRDGHFGAVRWRIENNNNNQKITKDKALEHEERTNKKKNCRENKNLHR